MGAQVRCFARCAYDANVGALTGARVDNKKRVGSRVDAGDYLVAAPFPPGGRIPQVGDMFVSTLRVRFGDTSYLNVRHSFSLAQQLPWALALHDLRE